MPPSRPFRIRGRRPGAAAAAGLLAVAVSTACGPLSAHERPVHAAGVSSPVAPDAPRARDGVHPTSIWTLSPAGAEVIEAGNFTCRVFARVTATGRGLLLRFANDYSPRPTRIDAVTVGIRHALTGPRARRITDVHFDGKRGVTIPAGTSRYSDPVHIGVRRGQSLAVSMYIKSARQTVTYHNYRPMTNYCTGGGGGDATHNASGSAYDESGARALFLSAVVAQRTPAEGAIAWVGDSVAEGDHLPRDTFEGMVDRLVNRMRGRYSVLNASVLGSTVTRTELGRAHAASLLKRLGSDVLSQPGLRLVVVSEGANDVRHGASPEQTIRGLRSICATLRARHLPTVIMTPQPSVGFGAWTEEQEQGRHQLIRAIQADNLGCDRLVDMATILTSPDGRTLRADYDIGDHLHPNSTGHWAVTRAAYPVILRLLKG